MGLVGRKAAAMLCGTALALMAAGGAYSQDAEGQQVTVESGKQGRVTQLQRLVIGAGQDKVAIDTPQAVTVVEQQEIDEQQAATVGEILRDMPGVNTSGSDRPFGQTFNIRGIGAPDTAGDEGRIIVNVDGAPKFYEQYRMGSLFTEPELYKRVEVLRGPASSTLYGSGALGGVINFETKDASDFLQDGERGALRLKSSYDSNGNGVLGSAILAQRMGDNAELLLSGNHRRADSYESGDGTVVSNSNVEAWSGLLKGTFKVGDEGMLRLSYQRWDSDANDQDVSQVWTQNPLFGFGTVDRHVVDQTAIASYENPFIDNDMLDVKIVASYSDTSVTQDDFSSGFMCAPGTSAILCESDYAYRTHQVLAQNTMEWQGDAWENYLTIGSQTSFQTRIANAHLNDGTPLPITFHPEGTDLKTGIFVQNEFTWDDSLTLIPGIRADYRMLSPDGLRGASDVDDVAVSPKIAALYKFNDTVSVFGSIAHTERFPTIDETFSTSTNAGPFLPSLELKKERSNNFEAGFALSGFDLRQAGDTAQLKVTGFYNDVKDLIALRSPYNPALPGYENISNAELYGFEIESAYEADYFFATAAYSYLIGKDKDSGNFLTTIAPHELALTVGAKLPDHGLRFGWRSRIVADPQDPARRLPVPPSFFVTPRYAVAFDVHDVFVSWKPQEGPLLGWEGHFGVDNIFDRQYKEFLMNDFAKGRTFKLSLSKQFGW